MNSAELQLRLKLFSYRVLKVCESLPQKKVSAVLEHQLIRSAFSAAANYRSACTAISKKAFIAKLSIALEEADESLYWLEVIRDLQLHPVEKLSLIISEAAELASILASSRKTAQQKA